MVGGEEIMADIFKPARILTERGLEIELELEKADSQASLLRCIAEAIAHLEFQAQSRSPSTDKIDKFQFYTKEIKGLSNLLKK